MKALIDPDNALGAGLAAIRQQFRIPSDFPPDVLAAAEAAAKRTPSQHVDRTALPFVTLDPATSTDLDQAFTIETAGSDLILRYAIADVAWFVSDGDPVDAEAWRRGTSIYLPDGKASLYPPILGEHAASLLPDGPRPAVIFAVRVAPDGAATLDGVERAIIHSRAKLAYDSVRDSDVPDGFVELSRRVEAAEVQRGAVRVDPPEQEVASLGDGHYALQFRPRLVSEDRNAALSLATNLAVAAALQAHHTGLFRVMAGPDDAAIAKLRLTAAALGVDWPAERSIADLEKGLDPSVPRQAALMLAIRRAGDGARYVPYRDGVTPWHAAMAATYAHATAPLRRLADRYVVRAALAIANGQAVPDAVSAAFEKLPDVMARADALSGQVDRAVIDLAEAVMLKPQIGTAFPASVVATVDDHAQVQLRDVPVIARVVANGFAPGDAIALRLTAVDIDRRQIQFAVDGAGVSPAPPVTS